MVDRVDPDGRIGLHVSDMFAGTGPTIRPGSYVSMDCRRDDGLWRMTSLVESVTAEAREGAGPDLLVSRPGEPRLVDRRRFLRIHANLAARLVPVDLPDSWDPEGDKTVLLRREWDGAVATEGEAATVFSLGAGGIAASVDAGMPMGAGLYLVVDDTRLAFSTPARVVWHEDAPPGGRAKIGCEFLWLPPDDEDRVLRYVVESRHRPGHQRQIPRRPL